MLPELQSQQTDQLLHCFSDDAINWFTRNSDTGALHYGLASGTSYKTTAADSGSNLSVQASYTDGGGNSEQVSSIATPSILPQVLTDDNFHFAIDQWFINETYATAAYGHISDWNTSAVTNMSKAFQGRTTFNEDMGSWDTLAMSQIWLICFKGRISLIKISATGTLHL